jgi:hypothetical protein
MCAPFTAIPMEPVVLLGFESQVPTYTLLMVIRPGRADERGFERREVMSIRLTGTLKAAVVSHGFESREGTCIPLMAIPREIAESHGSLSGAKAPNAG